MVHPTALRSMCVTVLRAMTGNTAVRAMACLSCLQCYEQTASSEETWVRHFTHTSWLSAWGGNTPAQFTVTPFAGKVQHSVFGLFQCAAGGLPGTWTRSERRPIPRHAEKLARGH